MASESEMDWEKAGVTRQESKRNRNENLKLIYTSDIF
jgi:hypothetical protein